MDQTDGNGVPDPSLIDPEVDDPSTDPNAPDPLLGESPKAGALSTIGSLRDKQGRLAKARAGMDMLQGQIGDVAKSQSDAYAAQRQTLQEATKRLLGIQYGPSDQESQYRLAAAIAHNDLGGSNVNSVNTAQADTLKEKREAEMQKQQLLTQYGMQIPQAQLGMANAQMQNLIQRARLQQSEIGNASTQADKTPAVHDKYFTQDPNDPSVWIDNPAARQADVEQKKQEQQNAATIKQSMLQFNATGLVTPELIDLAYHDIKSLPRAVTSSPVAMAQVMKGVGERAKADGNSGMSFYAQQQQSREAAKVLDDYEKGKTHTQLDGLNTAVSHINVFKPMIDGLANGDNSWLNNIKNTWNQKVMGSPAPTDFNGVKAFVAGEIAKAVLPGGGGEAERQELAASASSSNSPQALKSILDKWQQLLAGKTHYAKFNWDNSTLGVYGKFEDKFLTPETRAALGLNPPPAPVARPGQAGVSSLAKRYLPGGDLYKPPGT